MATSQQFHNMDGAIPQLNARQEAARHRNPQPCLSCKQDRQGCRGGYPCERCVQRQRSEECVPGPRRSQSSNGTWPFVAQSGQRSDTRRRASTRQPSGSLQSSSNTASAIGGPTSTSTDVDQHSHNTESLDGRMNSASPTGSTWLGGPFCGSPIGVDLPLQSTTQHLAGSIQGSSVFSLPFSDQVAMGQQDGGLPAVISLQGFQEHSFGHSGQQNVQAEAAHYTLGNVLSFQVDSQIPDLQQGFMQQGTSLGLELQAPMSFHEQENPPQTMHNFQYPPISGHVAFSQNTVGERASVPVQ
ncbi:hypothetical protein ACEPAH_7135 [Sanghuangporus vaninii]